MYLRMNYSGDDPATEKIAEAVVKVAKERITVDIDVHDIDDDRRSSEAEDRANNRGNGRYIDQGLTSSGDTR